MTEQNKLKIEFAPGSFDNFEGTQEELDELVREIEQRFANMTPEEFELKVRPLTDDELDELIDSDPELVQRLSSILENNDPKRKLQ